jgi:hypothetical protein
MKAKERICPGCGKREITFSQATYCAECYVRIKKDSAVKEEIQFLEDNNYSYVAGPRYETTGHRSYTVVTPCCGSQWTTRFGNFAKLLKNAKDKNQPLPCGSCGPKHRMNTALKGFMEKYARDYDLNEYQDYMKATRQLSDKMYKLFKHEINPENHRRGKFQYHLDHKFPIIECFKQGWSIMEAAAPSNLQMLPWNENLSKSNKIVE